MPNIPAPFQSVRGLSTANTAATISSERVTADKRTSLSAVYIAYSANVSVNVTVTINSFYGSGFDVRVATIVLSVNRWGLYVPVRALPLTEGDVIDVLLPAGGAGVTATARIVFDNEYPTQDGEGGYQIEPQMGAR